MGHSISVREIMLKSSGQTIVNSEMGIIKNVRTKDFKRVLLCLYAALLFCKKEPQN